MSDDDGLLTGPKAGPEEDLPDEFWKEAELVTPASVSVHLRLDPEVFAYFKAQGKGHLTRMQNILRAYVRAHMR
jgi:uncharacterized protein (DUF4415 family)